MRFGKTVSAEVRQMEGGKTSKVELRFDDAERISFVLPQRSLFIDWRHIRHRDERLIHSQKNNSKSEWFVFLSVHIFTNST